MKQKFIVAIDQSTSASKAFLVNQEGEIVERASKTHRQHYPAPGHVEHDMEEIYENVLGVIADVTKSVPPSALAALAISNQRETTVLWDRKTGKPVHRGIVWQDVRGQALCDELAPSYGDEVFVTTGLRLSPYFSAAKAASVLRTNPELKNDDLCIGTVDSYLIYKLTGGKHFACDISNASRTQLLNLQNETWDAPLLEIFGISPHWLPEVRHSDAAFGDWKGVPITGVMGDSHAALFGQGCHSKGMAKATYGTGSSVMMNVGDALVWSKNGLSASAGFGFRGKVCYVLEGNITCSGDTLCWLRDEAGMFADIDDLSASAASVPDSQGVFLVPAFSGLGAPYFAENARAILCGLSRGTTRAHIARAALDSMAYQDADVVLAMQKDTGIELRELRADGSPAKNALLMQFQADLLGCDVVVSPASELSPLGAAYMAGISVGIFEDFDKIPACQNGGIAYSPRTDEEMRKKLLDGWHGALNLILNGGRNND